MHMIAIAYTYMLCIILNYCCLFNELFELLEMYDDLGGYNEYDFDDYHHDLDFELDEDRF